MSEVHHILGDLLACDVPDIAQGCNTRGVMGGGISGPIAAKWPIVREAYDNRCNARSFVLGSAQPVMVAPCKTVWNLGTQQNPGPDGSLWGVLLSFGNMFEQLTEWGVKRVAIPRIGCGIAGLRWAAVERQITKAQMYVGDKCPDVIVFTHPSEAHKSW